MSIDYGLKYDLKKPKGQSVFYYLKNLRWKLKYAWQRAWRGWDDCEIHSFNYVFCIKMAGMMQQFKEDNIALFTDFETGKLLTEKETNDILDEMIYHFSESDGTKWIEANLDVKKDYDRIVRIEKEAPKHERMALELFCKWFGNLWI